MNIYVDAQSTCTDCKLHFVKMSFVLRLGTCGDGSASLSSDACVATLGLTAEECDDGNSIETDGCKNDCSLQSGFSCT